MDGRVSNGKYIKKNMVAKAEVKSLPIGISDYVRAQEEYYYVDKTLLIKEFLDKSHWYLCLRDQGDSERP